MGIFEVKGFVNKPRTVEELKDNIREEIAAIPAEMLAKTMENAAKRAQYAINARGDHLRDIIFKNWCKQIYLEQNMGPSNMGNPV